MLTAWLATCGMQRVVGELNAGWRARGQDPIAARIGVNTGEVVVGNMGSPRRLSYTVLGTEVNLRQRLESNASPGGTLISSQTNQLIEGHVATIPRGRIELKGLGRISVYEVDLARS